MAVAAVLIIGAADGLSNLRRLAPAPVRRLLVIGVAGVVLVLNVAFTRSFTLSFTHLAHSDFYETPAWVKDARRALAAVPADVSVAAQDNVVPRLVHRDIAAEISPTTGATDYVVALVVDNGIGTVINGGFGSSRGTSTPGSPATCRSPTSTAGSCCAPSRCRRSRAPAARGDERRGRSAYQGGAKRLGDSPRRVRAGPCELRVQT